ncbi:TetR/AcrR family transcriptional regulator [Streptomyces marokkonensis]|uniref:TetR/AcrR family transcriptional regulator n=1 Tax=Streptomyces marokkonensis TaxID=324855 RepID=A0ABP7QBB9_9ACTN
MDETGTGTRRMRTDKQRNRVHILEVAEQFFAEQGISGSMDAIAKRAGVGPGTLYRHFPNREALLAALLQARDEQLEARRDAIQREESDSSAALAQWLDALSEWVTAFDGLPEPLRAALTQDTSPLAITCQGFITTTDRFLGAAQRDGDAKSWVRARDLFLSTLAAAWARSAALADESSPESLSTLMRSGWQTPVDGTAPEGSRTPQT